jgi:hypothetical protein
MLLPGAAYRDTQHYAVGAQSLLYYGFGLDMAWKHQFELTDDLKLLKGRELSSHSYRMASIMYCGFGSALLGRTGGVPSLRTMEIALGGRIGLAHNYFPLFCN